MSNKVFVFLLGIFSSIIFCDDSFQVCIKPDHHEKMNIIVGVIKGNKLLDKIAQIIIGNLELGDQFNVHINNFSELKTKDEIAKYEKLGFPLIIFLNLTNSKFDSDKTGIEWRIYDTQSCNMIKGKKTFINELNASIAHAISDEILTELAGQEGCFNSLIVACKKIPLGKGKYYLHLYSLNPSEILNDISKPKIIVDEPTICLAPRWHPKKRLLYYSKHTSYNVRCMCINSNMHKSIVSNFDGLNLTPAFHENGRTVLSITQNGKGRVFEYIYDKDKKKGTFKPLTKKNIHAISPSFIDENNIVMCIIDHSNRPKIGILNLQTKEIEILTGSNENCLSPSYNNKNRKIVYCKKVNGYMQIFTYDIDEKKHSQITYNSGNKDGCSWSPCGNYIVFTVEKGKNSRIVLFNMMNKTSKYLTPLSECWSSPVWSPIYSEGLFVN